MIQNIQIQIIKLFIQMKTFLLIAFILLLTNITCDSFTATLSNSQTLTSAVTYVFNITFGSRTISAASTATLTFTLNYNINSSSLANCMFATTNSVAYSSTTCSVLTNSSGYFVLFNSIYPSQLTSETLLSLRLQMANPWGAGSENINSVIMDSAGTNLTLRQTVSVPYTAAPLNSCQWLSSSTVNGASSTRTISFIPSVQLIQTSYLQVTIPLWFQTTSNVIGSSITCGSVSNVDLTPTCSYTTIGSTEVYTFNSLFSSNKTVSSAVQLNLSTLYNPWSTYPFSPISFQLYNTQNGVTKISQSCSGISQTTSTLNTFNVFTISGTFTTINLVNTNRVIQFNTKNPILQSGAQLKLSWSGGVTVTYTVQTNIIVVSQNTTDIIISNFTASNILSSNTRFLFGWNFVNPPSSRPFYITLTSMYNTGGTSYGIDTMTNTYSCTPGAITTYSLSALTYAINAVTTYTVRFTTIYPLRSGSYIGIIFPTYIQLVLGGSCSSTNAFLSCSVANTSYANISISGTVSAGTSLTLTFNSVTNPNQAMTTGSFSIYTYYDSGLDSVVDRLTSGMTFTSIAKQLTSDVYVVPSSFTTYTASNYIFSVQMTDMILASGYISIVFPSSFTLGTVTLLSASFPTATCVVGLSGYTVSINSCFSSNYATLAITFTLGGITNPNSFQPTSSFSISTYGPIGMINYISSGLSVTMTTAAVATSFSLVPSDYTVHASTVYTLSTTFFVPHSSTDYMLLTIPASMQFSSTPSCSGQQGIALVACSVPNTTTLKLVFTTVPSTSIQLTINSIRNYDISSSSISFSCFVYNSGNYLMESTPASTITYTPTTITSFSVASNNQIILNQASTISITLTTPFSLDSSFTSGLTKLLFTIPSEFSTLANTSCTSIVGTSCTLLNSTTFSIAAPGLSITSAVVSMINVKLPYLTAASTSFYIQYVYNNLQVATVSTGVTVSAYCSSPCQQCSTSPSVCLSCLPAPNNLTIYYSTNNSCVNACPSGTFVSNSTCVACISPCNTCTTATLCLSCTNGTTFYAANSSCLSACPSGYYNDSNGNCSLCVSPCSTCTTATFCLSCSIDFLSNNTCVNSSSCPTGTYANSTNRSCDACQSPCSTCSLSQTNCTTCITSYLFYNNTCLSSCPSAMYSNTTYCLSCISPCFNCSSPTFCLSCISTYLYNGTCYNDTACPAGTFANTSTLTCDACAINCSTCSILSTNCTACNPPYFYYNGSCVNTCPTGMFQNGTVCENCLSPCYKCSSITTCLSCSYNYFTNFTCVNASQCPTGTFANLTALNCDSCSNNCTTCSLASTNCTSCTSPNFYYNSSCVSSCPSGFFQNSTVCQVCVSPCLTCTSATLCLSCIIDYYNHNFTCVNASACPTGTFPNATGHNCDFCSNNCTTCSLLSSNCTSCSSPLFLYNDSCVSSCPTGMFQNGTLCQTCVAPCLTCTGVTVCLSCSTNFYTNFTCVVASLCPSGTFGNTTSLRCDPCSNNCTTCSGLSNNCTSCSSPNFYYNNTCVSSCPSGMFQNSTVCQTCISPCLTCTSATLCLSCIIDYYNHNFTCVNASACPTGTFPNATAHNCDFCSNNCTTCSMLSSNCTSCSSPLFLYNDSCVSTCPSGMFQNGTLCQTCISPCLTCTSATVCLSCSTNFYTNFTCVIASLCPSGTFGNTSSLRCDPCSNNCTTCSGLSNNCTSCNSSLGYYNGTCLSTCPSGMYNSANVCTNCVSPCSTCSSATICISCSGTFFTNQTCVNASLCPAGTFANSTSFSCDTCTNNCTTCSQTSSNCTSCTLPNAYSNFSCVSSCPAGAFQNGTICVNCSVPCAQCSSPTACTTCTTGYFYFNQSCLNITSCPSGTYANSTLLNCSACISPCVSCDSSPNNCTSCISTLIYSNNQCVSSCPAQMFNSSGVCTNCTFPCGNCTSSTLCLTCTSGYLTNSSCVNSSSCPSGTYAQSSNNTCSFCVSPCANCYTISNCSTCANTFYYYNFTCLSTCPNGTFQNTTTCSYCDSTCLTCSISLTNCTSCPTNLNLFKNTCVGGCPTGTYNTSNTCTNCSSTCYSCSNFSVCTSCNGTLLLTNSQCLSACPNGTYADLVNNQCINCSSSCLTCSNSQSNCTSCPSNLLFTSNSCQATCPSNYFNVSGICTTCPNCNTCTNATTCFICATGYYLYAGVCYSSCPPAAPVKDTVTSTCSLCGSTCTSCSADGTFCFTCATNYLILSGVCYTSCPSGYTADSTNTKCTAVKTASIVYFPFSISLLCISFIAIFSKAKYSHSDLIGNLTALAAFAFLFSIMIFTIPTYTSNSSRLLVTSSISSNTLTFLLGVGIAVIVVLFIIGVFFNIYVYRKFQKDAGLLLWKKNSKVNRFMFGLISFLSCFHFAIFRFLYSKLFLRQCFSCYIKAHKRLLFVTNILTFITILLANVPSIALSTYMILKQEGTTQDQISAVDNLIITALLSILLLLDMGSRGPQDFQTMLEDFPYLKKTKKYQDLDSSSGSLISIHQSQEEQHCKTQADARATKLKAINIEDQLGNFGAIDQIQDQSQSRVMKTQPQYSKMTGNISFNPFQLKKINDDLFFQEKQYTKKFNEIKEEYAKGIFQEEVIDDDGVTHQNQDLYREHINVQEMINQRKKEIDPQEFLDKFRSEDYDNITEEEMAILMEMAEQKGLDPAFIKETFGKNKFYNKKILEELIGDHEQISNESAQALLSEVNSQSKLRQVLGQKSNINVDKLVDLLNDPQYKEIIQAMFNNETGFLSIDAIKDLLADNKKYSKDFIIKLLNNQVIDKTRLKMLLESNKEGELDALKTIKQLGGDNLENDERMSNLLGKESPLNPTLIPKIKKEMSKQSTSNIFDKKSPANTTMIKRVINNKRIKLDELNPIQEMPEIIQEFAELLNCGNEDMQENLIEMLETNNYDGNKLKELIENSGNSQEEMAKFLQYMKENKEANQFRDETPVENWNQNEDEPGEEQDQEDKQSSLPSLNFSLNEGFNEEKTEANRQFLQNNNNNDESFMQPYETQSKLRRRTKYRKKEPKPIHLPSQEIYLQRLQAPHEVQKNKKFRKAKKKTGKMPNKFMDEDNEVYDLDF